MSETNKWSFTGIGPGTYTFGVAPLSGMPQGFDSVPAIFTQDNNSGLHYVTNKTATGFTIVDRNLGVAPSVTVVITRD